MPGGIYTQLCMVKRLRTSLQSWPSGGGLQKDTLYNYGSFHAATGTLTGLPSYTWTAHDLLTLLGIT